MTLYFVRHGETMWNRSGRFQGRQDSPLTARGIELAFAYARFLRKQLLAAAANELAGADRSRDLPKIYSSPLGRAQQTAAILADVLEFPYDDIRIDPLLAEADVGKLAGHTWPEVESRFGIVKGQVGRWDFRPPGGESGRDQFERAARWLELHASEPCILISHGGFSRFFRAAYKGLAPDQIDSLPSHSHGRIFCMCDGHIEENEILAMPANADSPLCREPDSGEVEQGGA